MRIIHQMCTDPYVGYIYKSSFRSCWRIFLLQNQIWICRYDESEYATEIDVIESIKLLIALQFKCLFAQIAFRQEYNLRILCHRCYAIFLRTRVSLVDRTNHFALGEYWIVFRGVNITFRFDVQRYKRFGRWF